MRFFPILKVYAENQMNQGMLGRERHAPTKENQGMQTSNPATATERG